MKFTRIPETAFQTLQLNAGILLSDFTPGTGTVEDTDLLGATTGGVILRRRLKTQAQRADS